MVVVLDDRSDIWNFSPNLIRIKPCNVYIYIYSVRLTSLFITFFLFFYVCLDEFFVGTGDINYSIKKVRPNVFISEL